MKLLILISALLSVQEPAPPKGHLVIVGGGGTPDAVVTRTLQLAGGDKKYNPPLERSPGIRIRGREARNKDQGGALEINEP